MQGLRTPMRHKNELIFQVTRMDGYQITSQAEKYFYNAYASYDSIIKVKYNFLHHFFSPFPLLDFSGGLQIIKCIICSAAQQRNVFLYMME